MRVRPSLGSAKMFESFLVIRQESWRFWENWFFRRRLRGIRRGTADGEVKSYDHHKGQKS